MLLQAALKCYILYFIFILCASGTVKRHKITNLDKRIRYLRNLEEQEDNNLESLQPETDDTVNKDDVDDEGDKEQPKNESIEKSDSSPDTPEKRKCRHKNKLNLNDTGSSECPESSPESNETDVSDKENNPEPSDIVNAGRAELKFDLSGSTADKFLEIAKLSTITGFNFSPAEMEKFKIWPQGIIPFYIDEFSYDKILRDNIREYLDQASSLTGLRFLELPRPPKDDKTRWVFIINRRGQLECADYTDKSFTNTGVQKVVIGYDCLGGGGQHIAPIVLALAGVPPQHNSPDRDNFIEISMKSILPEKTQLFSAVKSEDWLFNGIKYDFLSAGHYPRHKYTIDGSATLVPKSKVRTFIGEADGLSYTDVQKIRMLYNFIISQDDKNAKLPDCSTLYRPGPKFKMTKPKHQSFLTARKKPKEYLEAAQKAGIEVVDGTENKPDTPESKVNDKQINDVTNESNQNNDNQPNENNDQQIDDDIKSKENNDQQIDDDIKSYENNNQQNDDEIKSNENNDQQNDDDNKSNEKDTKVNEETSKEILKEKKNPAASNPLNWPDHVSSAE